MMMPRSSALYMARIVVHTHGKSRERGYSSLISMYTERLEGRGVSHISHSDKFSHDEYVTRIEEASSGGILILLDETGESGTTEWMLSNWKKWRLSNKTTHLAIGPVDGFSKATTNDNQLISLGPLTMTYEMAAVVLLEQLYRASEIDRGSPYHRA